MHPHMELILADVRVTEMQKAAAHGRLVREARQRKNSEYGSETILNSLMDTAGHLFTLSEDKLTGVYENLMDGLEMMHPEKRCRVMEMRIFYQELAVRQNLATVEETATRVREG